MLGRPGRNCNTRVNTITMVVPHLQSHHPKDPNEFVILGFKHAAVPLHATQRQP
jgi:hypothetical protein